MSDSYSFMPPEHQHRESARLRVDIEGEYRFQGETQWNNCTIRDIGMGGVALSGKFSFYPGDKVDVRFSLDQRTLRLQGEVTNISGRNAGVRFLDLNEDDHKILQTFLHDHFMQSQQHRPFLK